MSNYQPKSHFTISVTQGTVRGCQHEKFSTEFGPLMGGVRKRIVTCDACGRVEIQRPYARR